MAQTGSNGDADLKTLEEGSSKPPDTRIKSVAGVRSRIAEIKQGDRTRSLRRDKIQGLIDGNQPYNPGAMKKAGRGDDANINFREAEGMIAAATTPYYDLVFEVPRAVGVEVYFGDNLQRMIEWGNIISEKYTKTLWNWKGYDRNTQLSHWQMVVHGVGLIMWDTPRGWHFEAKKAGTFLVADNASCEIDRLDEAIAEGYYSPIELWKKIDKKHVDKGWDVKQAKLAIINAAPEAERKNWGDQWELYQTSLRRGDVMWSNKACRIYYTDYLVKEFDGKITHCIVLENTDEKKDDEDKFLFKKVGRYESFNDIIDPFFYDVGPDGNWYSVKGLGPKIYDFCDLSNRFRCTMVNGAMASCGIPLKPTNSSSTNKIQQTPIVRSGGMTLLPPDWDVQQMNLRGALDYPMGVLREIQNVAQSNTGQYRQRVSEENQEPTLGQAQLNASQQATLSKGAYNRFYRYEDQKHEQILKRMLDPKITEDDCGGEEAKEFIEECIKCGVPKEVLQWKNVVQVKAIRNIGYGSPQMQQIVSSKLLELLGTMDEEGRNHALRLIIAPYVGQHMVDNIYKKIEDAGIPTNQEWSATSENNDLMLPNGKALVVPEQNPVIHFGIHFQQSVEFIQGLKQGQADPMQVRTFLHQAGPHMKLHLEQMEGDVTRKEQLQQMTKLWLSLAKFADQLDKDIAQAEAQKQEAQPKVDPKLLQDLIVGLAKVKGDQALKREAMLGKLALKAEDQQFKHEMKDADAAFGMVLDNLKQGVPPPTEEVLV